ERPLAFPLGEIVEALVGVVAVSEQKREDRRRDLVAERACQPVAHRLRRRAAGPLALDERAHPCALRMISDRRRRERAEQKTAPAGRTPGGALEGESRQPPGGEAPAGKEPTGNDPRSGADLEAAVADRRQHVPADDACIGGPDAATRRLDDARIFRVAEPSP